MLKLSFIKLHAKTPFTFSLLFQDTAKALESCYFLNFGNDWPTPTQIRRSCSEKNDKIIFSKKSHFLEKYFTIQRKIKQNYKIYFDIQVDAWVSVRKKIKLGNVENNIEYLVFFNCCKFTFISRTSRHNYEIP